VKTSPGEAKQGMTFDITCSQNIQQQTLQNWNVPKHRRNMVAISTRNKKIGMFQNTGGIWLQLVKETK
jgi:microcystin-dependent protein